MTTFKNRGKWEALSRSLKNQSILKISKYKNGFESFIQIKNIKMIKWEMFKEYWYKLFGINFYINSTAEREGSKIKYNVPTIF